MPFQMLFEFINYRKALIQSKVYKKHKTPQKEAGDKTFKIELLYVRGHRQNKYKFHVQRQAYLYQQSWQQLFDNPKNCFWSPHSLPIKTEKPGRMSRFPSSKTRHTTCHRGAAKTMMTRPVFIHKPNLPVTFVFDKLNRHSTLGVSRNEDR
ncbi:hypothetical protein [Allomuricauda sp. F6463D]|uniref:hypothetical protein n=1 Tax=Allomuricauda sp. F6463D TaxID=2926409 RepID=UPI001FF4442E|nr:hypothetical protein [Muricauda sp. F6463D]MCK0159083.1 hypothetical protein [Muricauda sp. F6463D]